jgi:hypothetical protein
MGTTSLRFSASAINKWIDTRAYVGKSPASIKLQAELVNPEIPILFEWLDPGSSTDRGINDALSRCGRTGYLWEKGQRLLCR